MKLISWADAKEKKTRASTVPWTHCFVSYATMDKAWSTLSERQVLKTTIKDGRVGVRWDVDDWIQYIGEKRDVLEEMHFPRFRDDHPYVLIVRGDGFPCGKRSWCQVACGFANHLQKARTLLYSWTVDLALVSEHETDLVCVLFGETLKKIQQIFDRGYILLRGFWVRTVVIIGSDSPWLRHILSLSTFYKIGSIYSFATWCREKERWVGCAWRRSTRLEAKFLKYRQQGVSCVGAKGCIESPLLKVDDLIECVIMCFLHLVIRCGEYLTTFVRTRATMLTIPQRSKVQSLLKDAKTNMSLKGRSFPDGEETWHLFANWLPLAKSLRLTPHVTTIVADIGKLLTAIYRWTYDPFVQGCAQIAIRFQNTTCPHKRSPYLLWLRNEGAIVLDNLQPWGGGHVLWRHC